MTSSSDPGLKSVIPTPSKMQVAKAKKIAIRNTAGDLLACTASRYQNPVMLPLSWLRPQEIFAPNQALTADSQPSAILLPTQSLANQYGSPYNGDIRYVSKALQAAAWSSQIPSVIPGHGGRRQGLISSCVRFCRRSPKFTRSAVA